MKKVLIGCPVRNRAWILPRYLQSLRNLDYDPSEIEYCFVVNDSIDNTLEILRKLLEMKSRTKVRIINCNLQGSNGHQRGQARLFPPSYIKKYFIRRIFKTDCEYLLTVDSDIFATAQ